MPHIPRLIIPVRDKVDGKADFKESTPKKTAVPPDEDCTDLSPVTTGSPRPGSSCYALREAVANLTFWDDFEAVKIGSGFFSDVYKIRHHGNGNVMVVKMSKTRKDRLNQQKVLQELELLNRLNHPNVVRYMGACVKDGHIHPLLEYISGGSLEDVLKDQKVSLSWQQKASIATDIARGMEYLHSKNVCHRDLKSENCLLKRSADNDLEAVVADFGLARQIKLDVDNEHPQQESPRRMSLVGSPFWMAPEILRGEEYTKTVDVFSFGIILCEIMARIPADPDDLPRTNLFGLDVDGFRKLCPGCPADMLQLAADCCSMVPTERPSFTEIYHSLCHINHHLQSSTTEGPSTHVPEVSKATRTQNGTIVNGNCCQYNGQLHRTSYGNEKEMQSVFDNTDDNMNEATSHEAISEVQKMAPNMTKTSRVLRALYVLSAFAVFATLSVLNFWQAFYTLLSVLVPLTLIALYPVLIQNWWRQSQLTYRMSGLLHNMGRRLSWNYKSPRERRFGVSGINMLELISKAAMPGHNESERSSDLDCDNAVNGIQKTETDIDTTNTILSKELDLDLNDDILPPKPKVLCTRRRLSSTLLRAGSFGLHNSIEEHVDESRE